MTATWVIGRGLIGAAVVERLGADRSWTMPAPIDWANEADRDIGLRAAAARFLDDVGDASWQVVWTAGAGVVGTGAADVLAESRALSVVLDTLERAGARGGTVFLASSAGGVYAGSQDPPFDEDTPPVPLTPYGFAKVEQEVAVAAWAARTGNRAVIGRIANVYGPGQDLGKAQGLVSRVCLSLLFQTPLTLYVPLDTIRDYVYVDDCAEMVVAALTDAAVDPPGSVVMRIIATGSSATVGQLLEVGRRVVKRHLPVVTVEEGPAVHQARDLRLDPRRPFPSSLRSVSLPVGLRATFNALLAHQQEGRPLPNRPANEGYSASGHGSAG